MQTDWNNKQEHWDIEISSKKGYLDIDLKEIWRYRDLLIMFVKKDIITVYKQTILGPIWFLIQPVLTTVVFVIIFGRVANIKTGTVPPILFYLGSLTLWNYFSETLGITSKTFSENASVFGKVYFPRIILPLSRVVSGMVKLLLQLSLFIIVWIYYLITKDTVHPNVYLLLLPGLLLLIAIMSLGFGILITSLTTKYRDLSFLVSFGVQLLMYATPVIYPIANLPSNKQVWLWLNPLTSIFEAFKYGFLGEGVLSFYWLGYSIAFTIILFTIGLLTFNVVEKKFIDIV
jgi:lipopolysaccharide transport system permease protein